MKRNWILAIGSVLCVFQNAVNSASDMNSST